MKAYVKPCPHRAMFLFFLALFIRAEPQLTERLEETTLMATVQFP